MERLELDLLLDEPRSRWLALALLAIAFAFAGDLIHTYRGLEAEVSAKEMRLAGTGFSGEAPRPRTVMPIKAEEKEAARTTMRRLSAPWGRLFQALEAAQMDRVGLLAIEPDAESGTVSLSGEAMDYLAVLSYVTTLEERKELTRVHLARHELKQGARDRPVTFTITAAWKERR